MSENTIWHNMHITYKKSFDCVSARSTTIIPAKHGKPHAHKDSLRLIKCLKHKTNSFRHDATM